MSPSFLYENGSKQTSYVHDEPDVATFGLNTFMLS